MCHEPLATASIIMYSLVAIALCAHIARINASFQPPDKRYVVICIANFVVLGILLGFHVESDCSRAYINIGAILLAFWFCLGVVESVMLASKI